MSGSSYLVYCFKISIWLGALILGEPSAPVPVLTREWIQDHYSALFLGCSLVGAAMGVAAYFTVLLLWRMDVVKQWEQRRNSRKNREDKIKVGGSS